jgi:hypothetical protein
MSEETLKSMKLPLPTRIARRLMNWFQRAGCVFREIPITAIEPAYRAVTGRKWGDDEDSTYTWPELLTAYEAEELFKAAYWDEASVAFDESDETHTMFINSQSVSRTRIYVR